MIRSIENWRKLDFAPQGSLLAVTGRERKEPRGAAPFLALFDAATGRLVKRIATENYFPETVAFSPDGKTLATYGFQVLRSRDGKLAPSPSPSPVPTMRFWNVATGNAAGSLPIYSGFSEEFAWLNDSIVAISQDSVVRLWNVPQKKPIADLEILESRREGDKITLEWLVATPDGAFDASPGADKFLRWLVYGKLQAAPPGSVRRVPGLLAQLLN